MRFWLFPLNIRVKQRLSTIDFRCRGNFVNIQSSVIKCVMAAVAKRQWAAIAQQLFRNFNTLNIFLVNFEKAFASPFDENPLRDHAVEADVEHGIVNQSLIRHGQFAIVFPAVGRQVEKGPGIDRGLPGLECDFHECPFIA